MISNQTIKLSIDKLKAITKIDFSVRSLDGYVVASTTAMDEISVSTGQQFAASPADSQELQGFHFFKVMGEEIPEFILIAKGSGEDVHMVGRIAVSQLQDLIIASCWIIFFWWISTIARRSWKLRCRCAGRSISSRQGMRGTTPRWR